MRAAGIVRENTECEEVKMSTEVIGIEKPVVIDRKPLQMTANVFFQLSTMCSVFLESEFREDETHAGFVAP